MGNWMIKFWNAFVHSLGTRGGSLLLLTFILFCFYPLLREHDAKAWEAAMFILGSITTLITNTQMRRSTPMPQLPVMKAPAETTPPETPEKQ